MSGVAVAIAGSAVVGGLIASDSARKAGNQQADAISNAQGISAAHADRARTDVLDTMAPALTNYGAAMQEAQETVKAGTVDVMRVLEETSGDVQGLLTQAGADARKAIMGSKASATGVPRNTFDSRYNNIMTLPPEQQEQALAQTETAINNRAEAVATGTPPSVAPSIIDMQPGPGGTFEASPGFIPADQALTTAEDRGLGTLARGTNVARQDIAAGRDSALATIGSTRTEALNRLDPYSDVGQQALNEEAALSGALGPEAQQQAMNSFIESPGQKYLREQQEQSLLRNASAVGGLGGGRVRTALQEQAMGIAATQQQQRVENLRSLAGRGQTADTNAASIWTSTGGQEAGIQTNAATQMAQLADMLGVRGTNLISLTGQQRSDLAMRTGLSLAQLDQAIGAAKAGALGAIGQTKASTIAGSTSDLAGIQQSGATNKLNIQQNISQMLANIGVGAGSQLAGLEADKGSSLAASQMLQGQALTDTVSSLGQAAAYGIGQYNANKTPAVPGQDVRLSPEKLNI